MAGKYGIYAFRIQGRLNHLVGSLLPEEGAEPSFAQMFVLGTNDEDEIHLRIAQSQRGLDPAKVKKIVEFLTKNNPYAQIFRLANEISGEGEAGTVRILSMPKHDRTDKRYNRPTIEEVAMIIEGDGEVGEKGRDIILRRRYDKDNKFQRVSEKHTAYLSVRYPIIFWYGNQGWDEAFRNPTKKSKSSHSTD